VKERELAMSRSALIQMCLLGFISATFIGCGGETGPKVYPVTGTVLYNGQPVDGAVVAFRGESATKMATGTTDAQGHFELTTYKPGDGAVPGKHTVTVAKTVQTGGGASGSASMEEALENPPAQAESRSELPEKYADPATSQLEFTVSDGGANDFTIELTD